MRWTDTKVFCAHTHTSTQTLATSLTQYLVVYYMLNCGHVHKMCVCVCVCVPCERVLSDVIVKL